MHRALLRGAPNASYHNRSAASEGSGDAPSGTPSDASPSSRICFLTFSMYPPPPPRLFGVYSASRYRFCLQANGLAKQVVGDAHPVGAAGPLLLVRVGVGADVRVAGRRRGRKGEPVAFVVPGQVEVFQPAHPLLEQLAGMLVEQKCLRGVRGQPRNWCVELLRQKVRRVARLCGVFRLWVPRVLVEIVPALVRHARQHDPPHHAQLHPAAAARRGFGPPENARFDRVRVATAVRIVVEDHLIPQLAG